MTPLDLEKVYDALAQSLDAVGPEKSELFLAKLALLLANDIGDSGRVLTLIEAAKCHLEAAD